MFLLGPFHKPRNSPEALLRSNSAARNLRIILWRQLQRYFEKVSQHGRPCLWMPLNHSCSFRENDNRLIFLIFKSPKTLNGAKLDLFVSIQRLNALICGKLITAEATVRRSGFNRCPDSQLWNIKEDIRRFNVNKQASDSWKQTAQGARTAFTHAPKKGLFSNATCTHYKSCFIVQSSLKWL